MKGGKVRSVFVEVPLYPGYKLEARKEIVVVTQVKGNR